MVGETCVIHDCFLSIMISNRDFGGSRFENVTNKHGAMAFVIVKWCVLKNVLVNSLVIPMASKYA